MSILQAIIEPWQHGEWMWRATLGSLMAALPCAALGVFLYLRRLSLMADALAHVALPGIVVAFLISGESSPGWMLGGAIVSGALASVLIEGLRQRPGVRPDAAIGIVFTTLFALGVILLSTQVKGAHLDLDCVLFGNVLGIEDSSLWLLALCDALIFAGVAIFWRWLVLTSFDERLAVGMGIPAAALHYGLQIGVSITCVSSFEAVGSILVIAMIIIPAATAHLLVDRVERMLAVALTVGALSAITGMYGAVWLDVTPAGAMVLAAGCCWLLAALLSPRHGALPRAWRRHQRARVAHSTHDKTG